MWESFSELKEYAKSFNIELKNGDLSYLHKDLTVEGKRIPNRLLVQPVEGTDAAGDGAIGELTRRRYLRYANGGAGTVWMEATALNGDVRSSERQLVLSEKTLYSFSKLIEEMKENAVKRNGYAPVIIIQITHPGRNCLDPKPASDSSIWESIKNSKGRKSLSDEEIERLTEEYKKVARLAERAGFDGVEIKACHRVFINELLSARNREGRYGGSFENRTRHLKEAAAAARSVTKEILIAVRLSYYDGIPFPDGFGMSEDKGVMQNSSEPLRLISELKSEFGVELINCTSNNPVFELFKCTDSKSRLFEEPVNAIINGTRMHQFAAEIKEILPEIKVVATMFSHLKQHAAHLGAGIIERGEADLIGFGRQALAYPDFARDILIKGEMDPSKACVYCSGCNKLLGTQKGVGCIVFDKIYKE